MNVSGIAQETMKKRSLRTFFCFRADSRGQQRNCKDRSEFWYFFISVSNISHRTDIKIKCVYIIIILFLAGMNLGHSPMTAISSPHCWNHSWLASPWCLPYTIARPEWRVNKQCRIRKYEFVLLTVIRSLLQFKNYILVGFSLIEITVRRRSVG